ncbi:MAG: hypothetical protein IKV16_06535 [Clostridia bacterium]|nr:hypothetical protein [Clostridia bacterium]
MNIEIERKYIIKLPDTSRLTEECGYTESDIVQIYLSSEPGVTHRIRSRRYGDKTVYTETKKTRIDKMSAYEDEREISEAEFSLLSKGIDAATRPIIKKRVTFDYLGNTVEIDIYPDWHRHAILETELLSREACAALPEYIEIVREVTGDFRYSNAVMARSFPEE